MMFFYICSFVSFLTERVHLLCFLSRTYWFLSRSYWFFSMTHWFLSKTYWFLSRTYWFACLFLGILRPFTGQYTQGDNTQNMSITVAHQPLSIWSFHFIIIVSLAKVESWYKWWFTWPNDENLERWTLFNLA